MNQFQKPTFLTATQKGIHWKSVVFLLMVLAVVWFFPFVFGVATGVQHSILMPLNIILCTVGFLWLLAQAQVLPLLNQWHFNKRHYTAIAILAIPVVGSIGTVGIVPDAQGGIGVPVAKMLMIGAFEELLFRGLLLLAFVHAYMKQGVDNPVFRTLFLLTGVFGVVHFVSIAQMGLGAVFLQVLQECLMAFVLFAFVLIVRNIWILIVLQGLNNATHMGDILPTGFSNETNTLILVMIMSVAYGFMLTIKDEDSFMVDMQGVIDPKFHDE